MIKRVQPITAIQNLTAERKQQTKKTPKNEKTTKQLLGTFYSDKQCLENLLKDESMILFHINYFLNFVFLSSTFKCLLLFFHAVLVRNQHTMMFFTFNRLTFQTVTQ